MQTETMEKKRCKSVFTFWFFLAGFLSQNLVIPVMCRTLEGLADQKNYYTPSTPSEPHTGTPPHKGSGSSQSHGSPPHGSSGSYGSPPSHGSSGSTPSHGGGGSYGTPSQGGGSYGTPSQGGGYYHSPPSHSTPATTPPYTPPYYPTPTVPISTPSTPSTPLIPDPNSPLIGTWNFWRDHPGAIWGVFGYFATVGGIFGALCTPVYGRDISLQQALSNTRSDGIGLLYREGTAALLNSMVNKKYPFTPQQVRNSFTVALVSDKAAAAQAEVFKKANEGRLKLRA